MCTMLRFYAIMYPMNIYVDFDDCLCETARYFSSLVKDMFDLDVPYEKIRYFNLQESFSLSDEDYDKMMIHAHKPEVLLSYEETPGAALNATQIITNQSFLASKKR